MKRFLRNSAGQTLVEIAIGMTILSTILLGAASAAVSASRSGTDSYLEFLGTLYVQQGLEQMRMYRSVQCPSRCASVMQNWLSPNGEEFYINTGTGATQAGGDPAQWSLSSTSGAGQDLSTFDDPTGKFSRYIVFPACNGGLCYVTGPDSNLTNQIIQTKVEVHVTWKDQGGQPHDISQGTTLTDWKSAE